MNFVTFFKTIVNIFIIFLDFLSTLFILGDGKKVRSYAPQVTDGLMVRVFA